MINNNTKQNNTIKGYKICHTVRYKPRCCSCILTKWAKLGCLHIDAAVTSVVRYPRYLDTYRRYRRDDTSIVKVAIPRYIVEQIITVRRRNFTQVSLVSPTPCSSFHYSNVQNFKVQSSNFTYATD